MITITNLTKTPVDKKLLTAVAKKVLKGENILTGKDLSIVFLSSGKIKGLNKKYRKKDKPTDVLSFEIDDGLGEIVICPDVVKKNAKGNFKKELSFVLIHGILHFLGYDHEKSRKEKNIMQKKEKQYLWQGTK